MLKRFTELLHKLHHTVILIHVCLALAEISAHALHMIPAGLLA